MTTINISKEEEIIYKDFNEGNSVQVRVTVVADDEDKYRKGTTVNVVHGDARAKAKIVSEPLVIGHPMEGEDKTISLILEKV